MALPKELQRQLDEAELIQSQLIGVPGEQTETDITHVEPTTVVAPEVPTETPVVAEEVWEHKYKTLQAKFDAEVPRLHAQVRELNANMLQLTREKEAATKVVATPAPSATVFSDQDKEVYGADLLALLERSQKASQDQIQELKAKIAEQERSVLSVEQQSAMQAEELFFRTVSAGVPDWEQINTDSAWVEWLSGRFPGANNTRQEMLNLSRQKLDAVSVTELFQAFKASVAKPVTSVASDLKRQVAPPKGGASSPAPADTNAKRIWSSAEITSALDPRKLAKMSPQDRERVVAEIDAASAEGRVLP